MDSHACCMSENDSSKDAVRRPISLQYVIGAFGSLFLSVQTLSILCATLVRYLQLSSKMGLDQNVKTPRVKVGNPNSDHNGPFAGGTAMG